MVHYKDLYGINKVLLLLNEHGDPSFLFPNLNSYNINNQLAKSEKNLSVGSISVECIKRDFVKIAKISTQQEKSVYDKGKN